MLDVTTTEDGVAEGLEDRERLPELRDGLSSSFGVALLSDSVPATHSDSPRTCSITDHGPVKFKKDFRIWLSCNAGSAWHNNSSRTELSRRAGRVRPGQKNSSRIELSFFGGSVWNSNYSKIELRSAIWRLIANFRTISNVV